jgi:hypothetical protein
MSRLSRALPHLLLIVEIALFLSICRDIALVTTRRLYLAHRVEEPTPSSAAQRFVIEERRVVPQIVTREKTAADATLTGERIAFRSAFDWPSTLQVEVRSAPGADYEIHWRDRDANLTLASGRGSSTLTARIPGHPGVVEFVSRGPVTWVDPRMVGDLRIAGRTVAFVVVGMVLFYARRLRPAAADLERARLAWFRRFALASGIVLTLACLELGLRVLGDRVPPLVAAERHDLGEVRSDDRWEDTRRFGRRLRAGVDAINEWRYGDIVRMGFIPADVADGVLHRFRFHTDAEGFRNPRVRDRIDVAALGDSFTDAMTIDAADAWTTRLERDSGLAVQNYGTAGFGPQQELRVLTDYALRHHPRVVVLAYFAGNDLFDAEAFEEFEQSDGAVRRAETGWQIREVVSLADTWFVGSALRAAVAWSSARQRAEAQTIAAPAAPSGRREQALAFDRGMFMMPIEGRAMRWAFMPAYLNTLNFSQQELAARRGWALTRAALIEMRDASSRIGAEFVVMFLPFKEQIHLPLLDAAMPRPELTRAVKFSLDDLGGKADVSAMLRNRLAQNNLMRVFCADAGIRFADMTPILDARVRQGENVYFPDESHLNETGHAIVADALRNFLNR